MCQNYSLGSRQLFFYKSICEIADNLPIHVMVMMMVMMIMVMMMMKMMMMMMKNMVIKMQG